MEKDKKNQASKTNQLSLEFSNKSPINQNSCQAAIENSRIISLSDYKMSDKGKTDYTSLVLKYTKSF
ncbi:hypothetical protein EV144_102499 [Flavobacterium sp. 270]|uniref:hypothetical protein n=1 Tax=Flavobacterium sp. 270 TaxID=2512114 RepID=UPI0010657F89|nr:hypothetical protein [Flavobacterium sp. 270]TDW50065.1 hypothetical protein EV144_102499 [Flavobacterium sp. 270]